METNACDVNHLESDVLLPPRKRLLAGFKRQNSNGNESPSPPPAVASSSSTSNSSASSSNVQAHLDKLLTSHINDPNFTPEEVAKASRLAAAAAVKAAKAARAAADEKAAVAAKAVAAAKSALELVASFPEEAVTCKERSPKRNKQKKHVPVEFLYTKDQPRDSRGVTDEDLACRLHRALNSSPRVLRTCSSSEGKGHKHKKQKSIVNSENPRLSSGSSIVSGSMCNGHEIAGVVDSDSSYDEADKTKREEKTPVCEKGSGLESDKMEAESTRSKDKIGEENTSSLGKKRGRVKLKKLPLSICTSRDQENNKEEVITKTSPSPLPEKAPAGPRNGSKPLLHQDGSSEGVVPVIAGPSWKCQDLKAPECVKQNKAVRS